MKILFDHPSPFLLAHGGFQIQIEQTKKALIESGVEVEWLRWWDISQSGDIIHYFGRPYAGYINFAHKKGIKVVMSELLTGLGSRSNLERLLQKTFMVAAQKLLPKSLTAKLAWGAYGLADSSIALTPWEKQLMIEIFDADPAKVHIIPNGVEEIFFSISQSTIRDPQSKWLVCTATITDRKRVFELAEAAVLAKTPVWIIGQPYSETDPYHQRFLDIVRKSDGLLRYEGGISDRGRLAEIYRSARGFVLLSTMESLSLSALEAVASGCPLLLSDLPWAKCTFGDSASYCPLAAPSTEATILRKFYDSAPSLPVPPQPLTWTDVADLLKQIYSSLLQGK